MGTMSIKAIAREISSYSILLDEDDVHQYESPNGTDWYQVEGSEAPFKLWFNEAGRQLQTNQLARLIVDEINE